MKFTAKKAVALLLALVLCVSCASCAVQVQAKELSAGYACADPNAGTVTDAFAGAMTDLSLNLFGRVAAQQEGNTVFSPLSAALCIGLLCNGASGDTLTQLEQALGMDLDDLNSSLFAFVRQLTADENCSWHVANSIWYRDDASLYVRESFLQRNADYYAAKAYRAPFDQTTVRDINTWCSENTDGMIKEILKEIPSDAMLYLINALCFEGQWQEKYENSQIHTRTFINLSGSQTDVEMLFSSENVWLENAYLTGFAKNYEGGDYSFVGLLPKEGTDVYALVESLTGESWTALWESRTYTAVDVQMPEFTCSSSMPLEEVLKSMGVTDLFRGDLADLSPMGSYDFGNLYCSRLQQEAFIQVDRSGTKAAAITWGEITNETAAVICCQVILDRPYVYAIVDNATGIPVFLGLITDLS